MLLDVNIANEQLWFAKSGDNLAATIVGTNDHVTIQGWFTNTDCKLDWIEVSDEKYATSTNVEQLVAAMAAFSPSPAGQLTLTGTTASGLASILAANSQ